ncbi:NAD(P)-dependent dehydrogenase (short-subunit alcohol dehydrogenase family) [Saccharopolyspora lacisalsi]|uniref:NAD(P)-dependent dehydrogenase (Short-subunit alcohol dehydrogenase family) n=1 Tax=Halosaccharopolyspora lacisalsi TaxID=1000566 RepID=A0A839DZ16_9PSEU|nr:NAD(P)-dependent dehydrogenase (short-subunit alcohol dehydrogenase family) [Halosaccharopolyspora lacisalsi]
MSAQRVDVSSRASVAALAETAAALGGVTRVAHTAGLSPTQASAEAILKVDLLGVTLVLEEFGRVIAGRATGVVVSSMAGHMSPLPAEPEAALAHTPTDELLRLPFTDPGSAHAIAKRGNHLRVQTASGTWGERGGRVNSVGPGVVSTPMGQQELAAESGTAMRAMIDVSGTGRVGTPEDIASATAFLLGPDSTFVTGTDLLVDGGGVVAALRSGRLAKPS